MKDFILYFIFHRAKRADMEPTSFVGFYEGITFFLAWVLVPLAGIIVSLMLIMVENFEFPGTRRSRYLYTLLVVILLILVMRKFKRNSDYIGAKFRMYEGESEAIKKNRRSRIRVFKACAILIALLSLAIVTIDHYQRTGEW